MNDSVFRLAPLLVLLLAATGTAVRAASDADEHWTETPAPITPITIETSIKDWPELSRAAARAMIAKYGEPVRVGRESLVWLRNAPWQKSVVYRRASYHSLVNQDTDYLKQAIGYRVPEDKIDALRQFDRRLHVDERTHEMSFQSDSEKTNFLALNLADEIVNEKRSVEDARYFFRNTLLLEQSGKSSKYTDGLLFNAHDALMDSIDWRLDPREN